MSKKEMMIESEEEVVEEKPKKKAPRKNDYTTRSKLANLLIDLVEVIAGIVILLLAVIGIITLIEPELRVNFFEVLLQYSDQFKSWVL